MVHCFNEMWSTILFALFKLRFVAGKTMFFPFDDNCNDDISTVTMLGLSELDRQDKTECSPLQGTEHVTTHNGRQDG